LKLILIYFILINVFSFLCFGYDKELARKNKWRIPERALLLLALFGGIIGALGAVWVFRHKIHKTSFLLLLYGVLFLQLLIIYFGINFLKSFT
jgi:uncharacterized membrane protein YsdA (DUF1294 family)